MNTTKAKPTILVVDDEPLNLSMLNKMLTPLYQVKIAKSGEKALEIVNGNNKIDLILLDINMPGLNGFEVCEQLKSSAETKNILIIFLTGDTDAATESRCLELGAVDFITKPINATVVLARINTQINLKQNNDELEQQHSELMLEKELVEDIILRMRDWKQFDPKDINFIVSAAEKSNGDIFMSAFRPDGSQVILVGDFTGHGLPAAVGNPIVAYIFYKMVSGGYSYQEIFKELNKAIHTMLPVSIFMAACLIDIDSKRETFNIVNAGLPDIVIIKDGIVKQCLSSQSISLGITRKIDTDCFSEMSFEKGEKVYVFSDGIIEADSPSGEMFGTERLEELLCQLDESSPFSQIINHLEEFSGSSKQNDDITIIELERS